ncbi:hypothetical protein J3E68DRAFT_407658 [Trichoderma sp. SZMC 28012]
MQYGCLITCSCYHWHFILISSPAAPTLSLSCPLLITSVIILAIIPPFPNECLHHMIHHFQ